VSETLELRAPDLANLAGEETGRGHLSHSSVSTQLDCLKKWDWKYNRRLELVQGPRPLGMGKAFQKAIELQDPEAGVLALRAASPVTLEDQRAADKLMIEETTVRAAAKLYLERWPAGVGETREVQYRVRLRSPYTGRPSMTFDLLGYADGVIDQGDHLELIENKFVGQITELGVKKLKLDRQVGLSCYGLWRATGKEVRVVRYRYTRKPSIQQKKGRQTNAGLVGAETAAEFCERVEADYADPDRRDFYSHAEDLFRSADDLLLLEQELWDWAEQLRDAKHRDFFTRNTSSCHDFGGCPYIPLCVGDPDAMSLYAERPVRELEEEAKAK
jgi:hypothetical protein